MESDYGFDIFVTNEVENVFISLCLSVFLLFVWFFAH